MHRHLFVALLSRELRNRYVGASGGLLWALAHPLLLLGIYAFVFRTVFRVELPDLGPFPFVAFVAVALWPWMAFQEGLQRGTLSIQGNAALIKKVAFPQHLLVIAAVASAFVVHGAGFALVLLVLTGMGYPLHPAGLVTALAVLAALFLLATGIAMVLGALQVFFRDVEQILAPVMMVVFYATPILYPIAMIPDPLRDWLQLNPLAQLFEPLRTALFHGSSAGAGVLAVALLVSLAVFALAFLTFRRMAVHFEDFV